MDDWQLLARYVKEGSQEAFSTLFSRHLNLVYSAARRQVHSRELADEVAQSVFLDLARQAERLKPNAPLASWIYVVTRITAQKTLRTEQRRKAREQAAFELSAMNATPSDWSQMEPLLDEAVATLPEPDRSAIVLRFFENQSLREIGSTLGISDDAAQKRVSRALDQLRTLLGKRGLAVTAAGLATDLSAHAIETAPLTLGATISSGGFLTTTAGTAAIEATKTVAMTTLQKVSLASALTLVLGAGLYEARVLLRETPSLLNARQTVANLRSESLALRQERAALAQRAGAARDAGRLSNLGAKATAELDATDSAEMAAWLARVDQLKELLAADPQAWIPEMAYLTDFDWINSARDPKNLTPEKLRETWSFLRQSATGHIPLSDALTAYLKEHGDTLPAQIDELLPYFEPAIDPAILQRYEILPTDERTSIVRSGSTEIHFNYLIGEKSPVDLEFDHLRRLGVSASGFTSALEVAARRAVADYTQTHNGQPPSDPAQLLPLLSQPVNPEKLREFMQ